MRIHELKQDPSLFDADWCRQGPQFQQLRRDDREFKPGDVVILRETRHDRQAMAKGAVLAYTGRAIHATITKVERGAERGAEHGIEKDHARLTLHRNKKFTLDDRRKP